MIYHFTTALAWLIAFLYHYLKSKRKRKMWEKLKKDLSKPYTSFWIFADFLLIWVACGFAFRFLLFHKALED